MASTPTRRQVLIGGASTLAAAGLTSSMPGIKQAWGKEGLTIVEWGGHYVENMKELVAKYGKYDIAWELHAGGSAAILPKIRSQWPDNLLYDMVAGWDPVFLSMVREGWVETVTLETVPALADVPEALINKDEQGNWKNIPRNTGGAYFAYREDLCPFEITSIEDLLDPRLKGQVLWPDPFYATNTQMVMLALARGGDEYNMEPGWEFMKELAKSGNIGRVYKTESEAVNSLSSGETCIGHSANTNFVELSKSFPVRHLTKMDDPGLKTSLYVEGWQIMKGPRAQAAMDLANFTITPENNEWWAAHVGAPPVNSKSKAPEGLEMLVFTDEEIKKYVYFLDWDLTSREVDGWVKRFEQEIVPLLG